jgi:Chromosome segregation ATPases
MKYGIIYYKETDNIGDDIQSYAAAQLLPSVDCLVDRESLNEFSLPGNEKAAVIFNGWFLHKKYNWPPSNSIIPLCISMHFTPNDHWGIGYDFLDGAGGDYLRDFGAVGCRDSHTLNALKSRNIDAYISGCLTLTLKPRIKKQHAGRYVCAVDISKEAEYEISERLSNSGIELRKETHWVDYKKEQLSWDERIQRVESLLDVYQNAHCIVTKRLHCALPCLAMGVPVLLLYDESEDDATRYQYFVSLLNVSTTKEFLDKKDHFDLMNPVNNLEEHLTIVRELEKRVKNFIHVASNNQLPISGLKKPDVEKYSVNLLKRMADNASQELEKLYTKLAQQAIERDLAVKSAGEYANLLKQQVEIIQESHDTLQVQYDDLRAQYDNLEEENKALRAQYDNLEEENKALRAQYDNLDKKAFASERQLEIIYRSRLMRIALAMRNKLRKG